MSCHTRILLTAAVVFWAGLLAPAAGMEVWTPQTGEVDLERRPRQDAEARFHHAAALLTAGEAKSASQQLRRLVETHPDAEWAEKAHFLLGMALLNRRRYRPAFRTWAEWRQRYPESERIQQVFALQRKAAIQQTEHDVAKGMEMFDQLSEEAPDAEAAALTQKARADALLGAGEYLRASDQYLALIDYYPDSHWVPYAWYQMGVSQLKMARWIGRGTEHLEEARNRFEDFTQNFPAHGYTEEAADKLKEVQALRANKYRRVALYYMGPAKRPTAALPYLRYITEVVPDSTQARWAERKIQQILTEREAPIQGGARPMSLPGVTTAEKQEGQQQ